MYYDIDYLVLLGPHFIKFFKDWQVLDILWESAADATPH